ncbi:N-acetyltransferase [Streptomyces mashuensis]|uniref:N-acetyltransferase n=1 Tax=Streptomyces mashuensis TaxID=33904 RepID=A0A919B2H9_9ACTN|nr:GNAT family N-acetyltransferase [Streptomyces mashuensis]GHF46357.1 N-acetyltransferase [Streptomyces mashuensis]
MSFPPKDGQVEGEGVTPGATEREEPCIVRYAEAKVPAALREQVTVLHQQAWPDAGDSPHDPALDPWTVLLVTARGAVIAALDILSKEIEHEGRSYRISGLSAVVTAPDQRGKGNGRRLVAAAQEIMAIRGADLGIFTCDRPLRAFYENAGWTVLDGTVLLGGTPQAPFPSDTPGFDKVTLAAFFTERARQHAHTFRGARIALYPGETDRLW